MSNPTVTVLMPVYNGLSFLKDAITSVLQQDFNDFELLVVDDASTDGSAEWVASVSDARIRLVRNQQNLGQAASLNRGLHEARGPYIARLDQDDVSLPQRLRKQLVWLESHPDIIVVGSSVDWIDSRGNRTRHPRGRTVDCGTLVGNFLLRRNLLIHPAVMFRRDVVVALGGYDATYSPSEDYELWTRLAVGGYRLAVQPETLVLYREHDGQQSHEQLHYQRRQAGKAHQVFVESLCRDGGKEVASLLGMEAGLWRRRKSQEQICAMLASLEKVFQCLEERLRFEARDRKKLRRTVYRWLGPGAAMGKFLVDWPSWLFYPVFFAMSPLLAADARRYWWRMIDPRSKMAKAPSSR